MGMDWIAVFALVGCFAACFVAASTGGVFKPGVWYDNLSKPSWNPPNWLFPVAWLQLYIMIAFAGWLVWMQVGFGSPFWVWVAQLVLNSTWSVLFFGVRQLRWAFIESTILWSAILSCVLLFAPVSVAAAWLMVPYLAWVSFACLLNWKMWQLNPGPHPIITLAELKAPSGRAARAQRAQEAQRAQRAQ